MSTVVFLAVIISSIIQASWNFFAKKSVANKSVVLMVGWLLFGLLVSPIFLIFVDMTSIPWQGWLCLLLSGVIHSVYALTLGWAYTKGDISVVYPIARGVGIALTTILTTLMGFAVVNKAAYIGISFVLMGTLALGLSQASWHNLKKGIMPALIVGCLVSSYSIVDSQGVEYISPILFMCAMDIATALLTIPILAIYFRKEVKVVLSHHKLESFGISLAGATAYIIILWAYTQASAPYVVALREMSIIIAAGLGWVFLKEKINKKKLVAISLILFGIILIKLLGSH